MVDPHARFQLTDIRGTPLVGRGRELGRACRVFGVTGRPVGVLLTGVTGIGKSRLANEIASLHGQAVVEIDPALQDVLCSPEATGLLDRTIARAVRLRLLLRVHSAHLIDPAAARRPAGDFSGQRRSAAHLAGLSAGNPSVLREIVRAVENECPSAAHGAATPVIPGSTAPGKLADARLAALDAPSGDALALIALAEPARLTAVEEVVDTSVLVSLEDRRLITTQVGDALAHISVADPLLCHVPRQETGPLRRTRWLASWKTALPESERRPDELVRIVSWEPHPAMPRPGAQGTSTAGWPPGAK